MTAVKTILVQAEDSEAGASLLSEVAALAATHGAHVVALAVAATPTLAYAGLPDIPPDVYAADLADTRAEVEARATFAGERLARTGVSYETRAVVVPSGEVGKTFARQARYADLTVFLRDLDDYDWHSLVDATLFDSGRPVLIVPPGASLANLGTRVAVAWYPGAEAVHAVHDALDLLVAAKDVHIVCVDPRVGPAGHGEEPGADLATMLARHGLPVSVDAIPRQDRSIATAILRHAAEMEADLVVSGAYGHSRLTEIILGGVTRDLMDDADRPLLMSH
ncbi:universal stress protein [Acuticoccus sp. I52.16.1]|uniref:universal stress protein n=1 Tax=Acuticoccus sp. I52.16.1 TaxID=2928472 RepID=UPI001FD25C42|nr:universal stress protein [Acuticoccus sp. I52.16.1]UOM35111.1 universal stress protein [Acuticoccus sp. I52.16.1]